MWPTLAELTDVGGSTVLAFLMIYIFTRHIPRERDLFSKMLAFQQSEFGKMLYYLSDKDSRERRADRAAFERTLRELTNVPVDFIADPPDRKREPTN